MRILCVFRPPHHLIGAGQPLPTGTVIRVFGQTRGKALDHAGDHRITIIGTHLGGCGDIGGIRPRCRQINAPRSGGIGDVVRQKRHPWGIKRRYGLQQLPGLDSISKITVLIGGQPGQEQGSWFQRIAGQRAGNKFAGRDRHLTVCRA